MSGRSPLETISAVEAAEFRQAVLGHFRREGRDFAWRRTRDPWAILVSEAMLQQTQTARVEPKYQAWMDRFPDAASVAAASTAELFSMWKGLGYNNRALRLREAAKICSEAYGGQPPADERALLGLPGVGRYTARAVLAFAYGVPTAFLETNIRAALLFHFHRGEAKVGDRALEAAAAAVLDPSDPRTWYYALMDYGAFIKRREPNPSRLAAAYAKQPRFEGSVRQARGAILRALEAGGRVDLAAFAAESGIEYGRCAAAASGLSKDGLVSLAGDQVSWNG